MKTVYPPQTKFGGGGGIICGGAGGGGYNDFIVYGQEHKVGVLAFLLE